MPLRMMGTETEYGIYVEGVEPAGLDAEAAELVRAYDGPCCRAWDYSQEFPRRDLRGFDVKALARDEKDAKLDIQGEGRRCDGTTIVDRVLVNGARLYNDHAHPEYSTPECLTVRELVAHERAGERVVLACARALAEASGRAVTLYKNNTDFAGMSYGAHENYLVARAVPHGELVSRLVAFLATRPVFAGAGKVGVERQARPKIAYQLSQRADFCDVEASVDTLSRRPLVNTRDEPHADAARYRRLHVICGDANMSEYALALKVGTTALVLSALEQGKLPAIELAKPVEAARAVSWDLALREALPLKGGGAETALAIQQRYLDAAATADHGGDAEAAWVLQEWQNTLDGLGRDWRGLADRLDWAAKLVMLEGFIEAEGIDWGDEVVKSLDLAYHDLEPAEGLYHALRDDGRMVGLVSEAEVLRAMREPPAGSRAAVRGLLIERLGAGVAAARWGGVVVDVGEGPVLIDLSDLVDGSAAGLAATLREAPDATELLARLTRQLAEVR
jgi:Pup amidohydrolase